MRLILEGRIVLGDALEAYTMLHEVAFAIHVQVVKINDCVQKAFDFSAKSLNMSEAVSNDRFSCRNL